MESIAEATAREIVQLLAQQMPRFLLERAVVELVEEALAEDRATFRPIPWPASDD